MRKHLKVLTIGLTLTLAGCVTQNVPIQNTFWKNKPEKTTVVMAKLPKAALYKQGRQGIVDSLISDSVTQPFQRRLSQYNLNNFSTIKSDFISKLQSRNIKVIDYKGSIDVDRLNYFNKNTNLYAKRNFMPYEGHIGSDQLLLISLSQIGALRNYYGFIPLGAPQAICYAEGRLIDLKTNRILWRQKANISVYVSGAWHQPPSYPNFIRALDSAVAEAKAQLVTSFFGA